MGENLTVLTVNSFPAKVEFDNKEGKLVELVGVLDKLPVDCLLGRSSFDRRFKGKIF